MKYMQKAGIYKGSNVTFNPETVEAYSYDWWGFVKKIGGKVIFNTYRYSVTTAKHQSKVRSLLRELGIKIDREVQCKDGIHNIDTLKELNSTENVTLELLAKQQEQKRLNRNAKSKAHRASLKLEKQTDDNITFGQGFQLLSGGKS